MEKIEASVLGITFRNDENGYTILRAQRGREEITAVGVMPHLSAGEQVLLEGDWVAHPRYGKQLKLTTCTPIMPTDELGIQRFLASGVVKGIGKDLAERIVTYFGKDTLTVISQRPELLMKVSGIGKKSYKTIAENYAATVSIREAMVFLQQYGVSATLAQRISMRYAERTRELIRQNPYRLCEDIEGIGFQTADRIAAAMGIAQDSPERAAAGLHYVLQDAVLSAGHIYLPEGELLHRALQLLRVEEELVTHALDTMLLRLALVSRPGEGEERRIYLPGYEAAERETAMRLLELLHAVPQDVDGAQANMAVDAFQQVQGISFSPRQREAILSALAHGALVITGGPGTGKTTIINCIISLLTHQGESVLLCAPTGRAAKRMSQATGRESKTIHRLLGFEGESGGFTHDQEEPLETDCVIVDETSMVDLMLMRALLRAIQPGTRLILVGDADQLPSVGAGNVLADILTSGQVPSVRLTDIYRQSETSRIVTNAHRINRGEMPLLNERGTDFFFQRVEEPIAAAQTVCTLVSDRLPRFLKFPEQETLRMAMTRIQVLTPTRKGDCGVVNLNSQLQAILNPPHSTKPYLEMGGIVFRRGDKVIQLHNDYELEWRLWAEGEWTEGKGVFNGDVGFITDVDTQERCLTVRFDDDREAVYDVECMKNLDLAYCLSVHKSQGSEFPVVVMPVVGGPSLLMTRNLLYTAMTRAKSLVVLVGREEVVRQMVENNHIQRRYTTLTERLNDRAEEIRRGGLWS